MATLTRAADLPRQESIYTHHLEVVLRLLLDDKGPQGLSRLFTPGDLLLAQRLQQLDALPLGVYTRLLQRQGPWYKAKDLLQYTNGGDLRSLQGSLECLEKAGLTMGLHANSSLPLVHEAIESCLTVPELRSLLKTLGYPKTSGVQRCQLLEALRKKSKQPVLFGASNSLLHQLVKQCRQELLQGDFTLNGTKDIIIVMVRVVDQPLHLIRRILRLVYAPAALDQPQSILLPVKSPALLASFGKIRHQAYPCHDTAPRTFSDPHQFQCWEAAMELQWAFEIVPSRVCQRGPPQEARASGTVHLPLLRGCLSVFGVEGGWEWMGAEGGADLAMDLVKAASLCMAAHVEGRRTSRPEGARVWAAVEQAYRVAHPGMAVPDGLIEALRRKPCGGGKGHAEVVGGQDGVVVPEYLLPFDAGWVLSDVVWGGVAEHEKRKNYLEAIQLLQQLLATRYYRVRRGKWWSRMSIDLCHLGYRTAAREVCLLGLQDGDVTEGHRLDLSQRAKSLGQRKKKEELLPVNSVKRADASVMETEEVVMDVEGWSVFTARDLYVEENDVGSDTDDRGKEEDDDSDVVVVTRRRSRPSDTSTAATSPLSPAASSSNGSPASSFDCDSPPVPQPHRDSYSSSSSSSSLSSSGSAHRDDGEGGVMEFLNLIDLKNLGGINEDQIEGRPIRPETGKKSVFFDGKDGETCTVEQLALEHYASEEAGSWWGLHCEGGVVHALFGLLMWDIIFLPVPGVFQSPFQDAPLDLDFPMLFYRHRQEAIEARLAELSAMTPQGLAQEVLMGFQGHYQTMCRGVNWGRLQVEVLQGAAAALGGNGLAVAFRPLCANYRYYAGGMPDLFLMRAMRGDEEVVPVCEWLGLGGEQEALEPAAGGSSVEGDTTITSRVNLDKLSGLCFEAMMVEIKGPRDRLDQRQTVWLHLLSGGGVHAKVCKVLEGHREDKGEGLPSAKRTKVSRKQNDRK